MSRRGLLAALALALIVLAFAPKMSARMADFEVYWRAGERAAAAQPLYRGEDEHYQLKYLPAFAILAIPLALVPLGAAKAAWFVASVALMAALLALSLSLLPDRRKPAWALVAITLVLMAKFYGHELVLGQVNLLFAVVVLLAVRAGLRGRSTAAGLLIALAIVIKPYAVIFVPWFAARRDYRALTMSAAGLVAALLLPATVYGASGAVALHLSWWETVSQSTVPNLLNPDNVSLAAMYAKWIGPGTAAASLAGATGLALLGVAGLVVFAGWRVDSPWALDASLLLTLIPLLSPQGWDYVFLISTPAVMLIVNYERALPRALRILTMAALVLIGLTFYDVMGRRTYHAFMMLSVISACYVVVVAALAVLRLRRVA